MALFVSTNAVSKIQENKSILIWKHTRRWTMAETWKENRKDLAIKRFNLSQQPFRCQNDCCDRMT